MGYVVVVQVPFAFLSAAGHYVPGKWLFDHFREIEHL